MKVMLRRGTTGKLMAYVAKKDLEEEVVSETDLNGNKILTLANGWELELSNLMEPLKLPQTVEAKRLS
ncbi:MAG TPA: putative nitrogen fixation protein NifT [Cyanobacteria bacterium UBA11149]|nr:putative nitrogen fixation protein NifT [Cyanobacteria bacterium UBA11367]HBE58634.1 putative nitrogen fixation protein NifT [Cyanobacteria bacterium UBA11366]HBR73942.1 putative nitrogen fixation protein NifT [Cyanobacteria bacterium UBA11159]HBS69626.1 putative nitrogen fixation protein NifT [Cyanobacteria bacterium UBA11153]HBW88514.1 putative nitrogen fixation protein NifT [Cyanobacteria bacterium UBA11149]HCA96420.1 putative nitrogen fixation protein NifT [Cyanobacteria bacterium UBA92